MRTHNIRFWNWFKKNGSIDNAEYQSIKKISEERAAEAKKYKTELEQAMQQIQEKDST